LAGKAGVLSHLSLHNSGKSFLSISMTLTLECGLLTLLYCTSYADERWYGDQCIVRSL